MFAILIKSTSVLVLLSVCMFVRATWLLRDFLVEWQGGKRLRRFNGFKLDTSFWELGEGNRIRGLKLSIWFDRLGHFYSIKQFFGVLSLSPALQCVYHTLSFTTQPFFFFCFIFLEIFCSLFLFKFSKIILHKWEKFRAGKICSLRKNRTTSLEHRIIC